MIDNINENLNHPGNLPNRKVNVYTCDNFDDSLERHMDTDPELENKVQDFLKEKVKNPTGQYANMDSHMGNDGKWGKVPKIKHTAVGFDMRLFYTLEGANPMEIKLYGVHPHDESGTGNPKNMKKQDKLATKMSKQEFTKL